MIIALAWASLLVFFLLVLFAGLPQYLKEHEVQMEKQRKKQGRRRFQKMANGHGNGYGKLNDDDLAELEGMFGEAGNKRSDYE